GGAGSGHQQQPAGRLEHQPAHPAVHHLRERSGRRLGCRQSDGTSDSTGDRGKATSTLVVMERLTGMDAAFFHMEAPDMHMHVMGTIIVDPATMPGGYSFDTIKRTVASRIHLIPPFRRRLVEVPFRLGHPVWIDDPDFDLDAHIHRVAVPAPHTVKELA